MYIFNVVYGPETICLRVLETEGGWRRDRGWKEGGEDGKGVFLRIAADDPEDQNTIRTALNVDYSYSVTRKEEKSRASPSPNSKYLALILFSTLLLNNSSF